MPLVFVIDDQAVMRDPLVAAFSRDGFTARGFASACDALAAFPACVPDVVLCDLKLPQMGGLEFLAEFSRLAAEIPVIMITAQGTVETAVEAMKRGAFDYLCKPFDLTEIQCLVKKAVEHRSLVGENQYLRAQLRQGGHDRLVAGPSPAMQALVGRLPRIAASDCTVFLSGESGVGKEVVARAIHSMSPRRDRLFRAFSFAELSPTVLESELFGHERGAFTGAERLKKGWFETADRSSLLIDEVTELPIALQAKLLRVLQERVVPRVGSCCPVPVDVRVMATSNRCLKEAVRARAFREDLYFRLNVLPVVIPPLRDRREDIPVLTEYFLDRHGRGRDAGVPRLTPAALAALATHHWPGTVRELGHLIDRLLVRVDGPEIDAADVAAVIDAGEFAATPRAAAEFALTPPEAAAPLDPGSFAADDGGEASLTPTGAAAPLRLDELERRHIRAVLARCGNNKRRAATALGIPERTLRDRRRRMTSGPVELAAEAEAPPDLSGPAQSTLPWG
ncbi:MAG: sigma-54-dependent Fis family transcriptional regulator [Planctomycetes bacterium]|nr:sigma-54-dependent Fis family transcriptional regulator [Planctomycetota bacterium]